MTCIVGLEYDGKVYMGGDSAAVANGNLQLSDTPKVFKKQKLLIGYTWSFRMGQIIQYAKSFPKIKEYPDNYAYLVKSFVPFIRSLLKDAGWLIIEKSRDEGGQFLVGLRGELFEINSDFSVLKMMDGFDAVGSGSYYALGALRILKHNTDKEPTMKIGLALEAAAYFSTSVSSPFVIEEL